MKELFPGRLNKSNYVTKGDLLLASPFLEDPYFERSVVLLCEHRESEGSFGLILNKVATIDISTLEESEHLENNLFMGGPVERNTLHFIHRFADIKNSIPVKDGIFWGGDYEQLKSYHNLGLVNSSNCRFFVGYSGWAPGQLKEEIEQETWIIARNQLSLLFELPAQELWQRILREMGGKYRAMSHFPANAQLN
ncbi:MAG: YqgE/AlgH family protein [Cytophagales bacterium]|nr:YqgE/AlgH family protein [Cytophagales bacterium]MDW8384833.1 YqgE/AlgH family protein [Flammeovirgaceae bacterium]